MFNVIFLNRGANIRLLFEIKKYLMDILLIFAAEL